MRNRGIPEGWSAGKASSIGDASQVPRCEISGNPGSQPPHDGSFVPKPVPRPSVDPAAPPPVELGTPRQLRSSRGWLKSWVFWAALTGLMSSGLGFVAVMLLLKLPAAPNCPSIFWPMASASVRLHCAQVAANKQTVDDLLEAIALVQALPSNHPLRPEINSFLEQWSLEILDLADEAFQAGKLQEAIAIAGKIPQDIAANQLGKVRISRWQSIWSEAEALYQKAEAEVREQHWHQAFMVAVRLLNVENNYWTTTKYDQLNRLIETARDDGKKLAKAQSLEERGGSDNLLAALNLVDSIGANSYLYQQAQDLIPELGRKILDLAEAALDRRDANEALAIANKIPANSNLQPEVQDFTTVVEAWRSAWSDTVPGLQDAVAIAQKIGLDRPLYSKAQELISRWQLEIEDVAHLERARELAKGGTVGDLTPAIAEAELIPSSNPRGLEAEQEINRWRRQIETIEDQPYLNRAEELANFEDVNSLQEAINEASQIAGGRALYQEAQRKISNWTWKIQRIEDQPYLDQARLLASSGDLPGAIAAARQIRSERALSNEAQAVINDWESQIQARRNWRMARRLVLQGTPDALAEAITLAQQVPMTNPLRVSVNPAIEQWSQQLLRIAQDRGRYDIPGAIAIAKRIPAGTDSYKSAQEQIKLWQMFLNPVVEGEE